MTFEAWWLEQMKRKPESEDANIPEIWAALMMMANDAWDSSRNNLEDQFVQDEYDRRFH